MFEDFEEPLNEEREESPDDIPEFEEEDDFEDIY